MKLVPLLLEKTNNTKFNRNQFSLDKIYGQTDTNVCSLRALCDMTT